MLQRFAIAFLFAATLFSATLFPTTLVAQAPPEVVAKIVAEGRDNSQVMAHLDHLTNQIGPRLTELHAATGNEARVFEGTGGIALVDSYRRGIAGTMPGADLIDGIVALWRALQEGDESAAYRVWLPLAALVSLQHSLDAFLAIEKHLLVKQGVLNNTLVRVPVGYTLDPQTRDEVNRLFGMLLAPVDGVQ